MSETSPTSNISPTLLGVVQGGLGQGSFFTQLDWVRKQFLEKLGIEPYPGTLNLRLLENTYQRHWDEFQKTDCVRLASPNPDWCDACCYPVRIQGRWPAAIVRPLVPDYENDRVELIAAFSLRQRLSLKEGDSLELTANLPLAVDSVLFDLDGTLIDSLEAYRICAQDAAPHLEEPIPMKWVLEHMNGVGSIWEKVSTYPQAHDHETRRIFEERARRRLPAALEEHARVFPRASQLLGQLHAGGARLGVVTGSERMILDVLEEESLLQYFDVVVTARDVRRAKPDPEGLTNCLEKLGGHPQRAVYVGDTAIDIETSRRAGMHSVAVLTGAGSCEQLSWEGPDWVIADLAGLPRVLKLPAECDSPI